MVHCNPKVGCVWGVCVCGGGMQEWVHTYVGLGSAKCKETSTVLVQWILIKCCNKAVLTLANTDFLAYPPVHHMGPDSLSTSTSHGT